ncbi:MAG: hypothetical protein LBQ87_04215 [Candidatus Fibromonas sp.]|nr:hypothetical protein [Candidatus Fibromonas sp.]
MPRLILFLAALVLAQDIAPEWIEESWRLARYPKSEWYIGYAKDNIKGQPGSKVPDCQFIFEKSDNILLAVASI